MQCYKCEHLPQLGELPLLRILEWRSMDSVRCVSEFYRHGDHGIPFFPSLEQLSIYHMYHFGEFSSPMPLVPSSTRSLSENQLRSIQSEDQAQVSSFPCHRILEIYNCHELTSFISLPPSLDELVLRNTNAELLLRYMRQFPSSLSKLEIANFPNLVCFPVGEEVHEGADSLLGRVINLTYLSVSRCPKFETLHINRGSRKLTNLSHLKICDCPELVFSHEDDDDFQKLIFYFGL